MRALFRNRRLLRSLMAAFVPYVAATLILDALHVHPLGPEHGALCRHHVTEEPLPFRANTGYECPSCTWQRNLPNQGTRAWSPDMVRTSLPVAAPVAPVRISSDLVQPVQFRGPPRQSL